MYKTVPPSRVPAYSACGWDHTPNKAQPAGFRMWKDLPQLERTAGSGHNDLNLFNINLVQRATICRPLSDMRNLPVSRALNLDYMGAAQFEFGAFRRFLFCIHAQYPLYQVKVFPGIQREGTPLRVFGVFDTSEDWTWYCSQLTDLVEGRLRMEEITYLEDKLSFVSSETRLRVDAWLDYSNNVVWSFDKVWMNKFLPSQLEASFAVLNAN
jgi:hypothetical protein